MRKRILVTISVVILGGLIFILAFSLSRESRSTRKNDDRGLADTEETRLQQEQKQSQDQPQDETAVTERVPAVNASTMPVDDLNLPVPRTTVQDLMDKGFPLMENPRKAAYTQTVQQNTAEVVADLGNQMTIGFCSLDINIEPMPCDLARYYRAISRHIKVMRLIEEGRQNPDMVSQLLRDAIRDCMSAYNEVWRARNVEWVKWTTGQWGPSGTGTDDEYYNTHRKYKDAVLEFERLHNVVYSSFYILANIGQQDPKLLAEWIQKEKHPQYVCRDMDVFLVDCYYKQVPDSSGAAKKHAGLMEGFNISGEKVRESAWNALWDVHHPLLAAKKVNLSDIKTIEVIKIPVSLPEGLDEKTKDQIIKNFLTSVKEMSP
jgi:hypothetical protein